jgi:methionyl-tRNA formyltransferase
MTKISEPMGSYGGNLGIEDSMIDERDEQKNPKRNHSYGEDGLASSQPSRADNQSESYPHKTPIVFFGSGPVAAASLELLSEYCTVEAVVTKPQPAHHKEPFPVLVLAEKLGLTVYTPEGKAALSELIATKPFTSRLGIVIDYGFIINQDVIDYFPLGIVNSHFSLLPEWRGADPITFSILSGQKQTGVSLMLITAGMDEGPLLAQTPYDMPDGVTTPQLTDDLVDISNQTLQQILPLYLAGNAEPAPQESITMAASTTPTYSRKLTKEDSVLDWDKSAEQLEREVRAYLEWPKSRTVLGGHAVIVTKAHVEPGSGTPGTIWHQDKQLGIYTSDGIFVIDSLKPAGKQEMTAAAFLAGYKL